MSIAIAALLPERPKPPTRLLPYAALALVIAALPLAWIAAGVTTMGLPQPHVASTMSHSIVWALLFEGLALAAAVLGLMNARRHRLPRIDQAVAIVTMLLCAASLALMAFVVVVIMIAAGGAYG